MHKTHGLISIKRNNHSTLPFWGSNNLRSMPYCYYSSAGLLTSYVFLVTSFAAFGVGKRVDTQQPRQNTQPVVTGQDLQRNARHSNGAEQFARWLLHPALPRTHPPSLKAPHWILYDYECICLPLLLARNVFILTLDCFIFYLPYLFY